MNKKYHIALIGGRGFVGQEVVKLIDNHPYFQLSQIFSTTNAGQKIKNYKKNKNLEFTELDSNMENINSNIDIVILALPNGQSKKIVSYLDRNFRDQIIIDISSDHRFDDDWT